MPFPTSVPYCPTHTELQVGAHGFWLSVTPQTHGPSPSSFAATFRPTSGGQVAVVRVAQRTDAFGAVTIPVAAGAESGLACGVHYAVSVVAENSMGECTAKTGQARAASRRGPRRPLFSHTVGPLLRAGGLRSGPG